MPRSAGAAAGEIGRGTSLRGVAAFAALASVNRTADKFNCPFARSTFARRRDAIRGPLGVG
jgi:hypothetical protein